MSTVISQTVLLVAEPFDGLGAAEVAAALTRGFQASDSRHQLDVALVEEPRTNQRERWSSTKCLTRVRAARAVVIAATALDERTLAGSVAFDLATTARQGGVPAYAVTASNALDLFDARMLDLQVILQARGPRALSTAGGRLAELLQWPE